MIRKTERKLIFNQYKTAALQISEIQKTIYHHDDPDSFESEAERNDYLSQFDLLHEYIDHNESLHTIIAFDYSDLKTYPAELSKRLIRMFADKDVSSLIVLSHLKTNFFGNLKTNHPQLKKEYSNLTQIVGADYYDEAFKIGIQDLETFIPIVFWMQRIDASSPEFIFFFDDKNRFSFYICNSGKVHIFSYEKEIFTSQFLEKTDWEEIDECINSLA